MGAILSKCGRFRYRLEREIGCEGIVVAYFGINPSIADASIDDATVRKWKGFSQTLGARKFIVGNISAYRATNVKELATVAISSAERESNIKQLQQIIAEADLLIPCWGSRIKAPKCMRGDFDAVLAMLLDSGKPVMHLGLTKSGDPKHPLMLGYDTKLKPWNAP